MRLAAVFAVLFFCATAKGAYKSKTPHSGAKFEQRGQQLFVKVGGQTRLVGLVKNGKLSVAEDFAVRAEVQDGPMWNGKVVSQDEGATWLVRVSKTGQATVYERAVTDEGVILFRNGQGIFMQEKNGRIWASDWVSFASSASQEDLLAAHEEPFVAYQFWRDDKTRVTGHEQYYVPEYLERMAASEGAKENLVSANTQLVEEKAAKDVFVPKSIEYVSRRDLNRVIGGYKILPKLLQRFQSNDFVRGQRREEILSEAFAAIDVAKEILADRRHLFGRVWLLFELL